MLFYCFTIKYSIMFTLANVEISRSGYTLEDLHSLMCAEEQQKAEIQREYEQEMADMWRDEYAYAQHIREEQIEWSAQMPKNRCECGDVHSIDDACWIVNNDGESLPVEPIETDDDLPF